jgi:hypothetical protein
MAYPDECLTRVLENGQCEEGVGVEVRQHKALGGQHGIEEKRHWRHHPLH